MNSCIGQCKLVITANFNPTILTLSKNQNTYFNINSNLFHLPISLLFIPHHYFKWEWNQVAALFNIVIIYNKDKLFTKNSFYFIHRNLIEVIEDQMRRKSDFTNALDDMFCQDDKKRLNAIRFTKEIAASIGPLRVRNELVPFFNEFLDDDPAIMLALIQELNGFTPLLGGSQYDKLLLPLLINFCLLDEKSVAIKALELIQTILSKQSDVYLQTTKKLAKVDMSVSKQCAVILIVNGIKKMPNLEPSLLQMYRGIVFSENPAYRIIAAKYFRKLAENASNKEQIYKIIDVFYNDSEDLPKLLTIDSLLLIYSNNPSVVINKIKILICIGTWRINIRLCEFSNQFSKYLNKIHFKTLLQPAFLKMMASDDNEIRAASCSALVAVAKNMTPQQNFNKLYPIILKMSEDKVDFVKNQYAKNFVKVFPYFSQQKTKQCLIPLVIKFLKQCNLEVLSCVLEDFKELSKHLNGNKFEQNILKPLANQLAAENWRLKVQTLQILGRIVVQQQIFSSFIVQILAKQMKSKIQAVRIKSSSVIINIIKKSPRQWCEAQLLPLLAKTKDQTNYLVRQRVITIIDQTCQSVSQTWLSTYKKIISQLLADKVPNIRMLALKCVCSNKKLIDKSNENIIFKMRDDNDTEIKLAAKQIKI